MVPSALIERRAVPKVLLAAGLAYCAVLSFPIGWLSESTSMLGVDLGDTTVAFGVMFVGIFAAFTAGRLVRSASGAAPMESFGASVGVLISVGLVWGAVVVFPAADGVADEYTGRRVLGLPGEWLSWVAVPLAVNAVAGVVLVYLPRVYRRASSQLSRSG